VVFPEPAHAPANELYKHIPGMTTHRAQLQPRHADSSRLLPTHGSKHSSKAGAGRVQVPTHGNTGTVAGQRKLA